MLTNPGRRHFLEVVVVGTTSVTLLGACSSSAANGQAEPIADVAAGNISALQVNEVKATPGSPIFIGRDSNGVYAMTTTCTHMGCDLAAGTISTTTITCMCHGSQFSLDGAVVKGPASSPLVHYAVAVAADGTMTVRGGTTVDASTRTPVA
jgi:cytochrome b6-f complex iron-sulfur subunit